MCCLKITELKQSSIFQTASISCNPKRNKRAVDGWRVVDLRSQKETKTVTIQKRQKWSAMENGGWIRFQLWECDSKMENLERRKMRLTFASTCNIGHRWTNEKNKSKGWKKRHISVLSIKNILNLGRLWSLDQRLRTSPVKNKI